MIQGINCEFTIDPNKAARWRRWVWLDFLNCVLGYVSVADRYCCGDIASPVMGISVFRGMCLERSG